MGPWVLELLASKYPPPNHLLSDQSLESPKTRRMPDLATAIMIEAPETRNESFSPMAGA